jgi:hypothetical protein
LNFKVILNLTNIYDTFDVTGDAKTLCNHLSYTIKAKFSQKLNSKLYQVFFGINLIKIIFKKSYQQKRVNEIHSLLLILTLPKLSAFSKIFNLYQFYFNSSLQVISLVYNYIGKITYFFLSDNFKRKSMSLRFNNIILIFVEMIVWFEN